MNFQLHLAPVKGVRQSLPQHGSRRNRKPATFTREDGFPTILDNLPSRSPREESVEGTLSLVKLKGHGTQ